MATLANTTDSTSPESQAVQPLSAESAQAQRRLILDELERTVAAIDGDAMVVAAREMLAARRVFTVAAGRSGLSLKMAAMRLMHLGLDVHVAGEVTTPAIAAGDLLIAASGSGTTSGIVHAGMVAKKAGARVLALTTAPGAPLAELADAVLVIPAASKQEHGGAISQQYAGALFEQTLLVVMDAIFQMLWRESGESAEQLWPRHANLE